MKPPNKTSIFIAFLCVVSFIERHGDTNQINCCPNRFCIHSENSLEEHGWQHDHQSSRCLVPIHAERNCSERFSYKSLGSLAFFPAEIRFDLVCIFPSSWINWAHSNWGFFFFPSSPGPFFLSPSRQHLICFLVDLQSGYYDLNN